mmetsp:Transcript_12930/g.24721  ORF Transcript_12930/g.24721 Transcript_12930/m.24721 type:complete len:89 (+) Transcript_12930:233-499(+)
MEPRTGHCASTQNLYNRGREENKETLGTKTRRARIWERTSTELVAVESQLLTWFCWPSFNPSLGSTSGKTAAGFEEKGCSAHEKAIFS